VRAQFLHPNTCHLHTLRGRQRNGKVEGGRGEVEGGWGGRGRGRGEGGPVPTSKYRSYAHIEAERNGEEGGR
jgi:hypothetical protein